MKFVFIIAALVAAVAGERVYIFPDVEEFYYPHWYKSPISRISRERRDVSWDPKTGDINADHKLGDGSLYGKLGSRGDALFGQGGYKQNIFDDDRGKLDGRAFGTRVLSPNGDSSSFGGGLDWKSDHVKATVDLDRQIHGRTSVHGEGGGKSEPFKGSELSVQGTYDQTFGRGRPDFGVVGKFGYNF